ncbi:hypothetical protein CSA37_11610 [Candidatus Fermentibacteria bacterium]|nr:MAG: hypothetical protein CSA37_11610 [Candidatus Fermentibacteria bacterium]
MLLYFWQQQFSQLFRLTDSFSQAKGFRLAVFTKVLPAMTMEIHLRLLNPSYLLLTGITSSSVLEPVSDNRYTDHIESRLRELR